MAVDRHLVANLLQLNGLDEYKPFRDYLAERQKRWAEQCFEQRDEVSLRHAQGRVQELNELLELLANAPVLADKYRG